MSTKDLSRLMIVTGDDTFTMELLKNRYLEQIKLVRSEFILETYDSLTETLSSFIGRMMTASLFQEIRVFCIFHAQSFSESELGELDKALDYEIPDVYLFIAAQIEKRSSAEAKILKKLQLKKRAAAALVTVQDCSKPYDNKLAEWITKQAPGMFNRQIERDAAQLLAELVEFDLLYSELQKIDINLPAGARIDKKIVEEITGATRTLTVFELAAALGQKDLPRALNVLDSLFSCGFSAPFAISAIFRHFWSLFKIKNFLEKNPALLKQYNAGGFGESSPQSKAAFEIGRACNLLTENDAKKVYPVIIKPGVINQSQKFTGAGLRRILGLLQQFDVEVKTGKTESSPRTLQMLCYRIARVCEYGESVSPP
ncbi:MAG: DNA polymerase III subunit delta [Chitinispirillales bacterium]|jgi:DNA polymerase III delta subunit|nr:DNA polymerase III subunit delta [Chitinispirillales bacterium]